MTVIGLTGNIGSGKTLAAKTLAACGAYVINADQIARKIVAHGEPACDEIRVAFGEAYFLPDGNINRRMLGEKVFTSPESREILNRITHPRIKDEIKKDIEVIYARDSSAIIVIEAAVLVEMEAQELVDQIWLIQSEEQNIIRRLLERDAFTVEEVKSRLSAQKSPKELAGYADRIIENDGDRRDFAEKLRAAYRDLQKERP